MLNISKKPSNNIFYGFPTSKKRELFKKYVKEDNVRNVRLLLNSGYSSFYVFIHEAAYHGSVEVLKLMIKYSADINKLNYNKQTPIMLAARNNQFEAVKVLVEERADLYLKDSGGEGLVYYASLSPESDIMVYLLKNGFDPKRSDPERYSEYLTSTLYSAILYGTLDDVKVLVDKGASILDWVGSKGPLILAIKKDKYDIFKYFMSKITLDDLVKKDKRSIFHPIYFEAIKSKNIKYLKDMLDKGVKLPRIIKNDKGLLTVN